VSQAQAEVSPLSSASSSHHQPTTANSPL